MVLFPLAVLWLVIGLVWVLRHSRNELPEDRVWRRWTPRTPRRPWNDRSGGSKSRQRTAASRER
jgi:hypothetical protein